MFWFVCRFAYFPPKLLAMLSLDPMLMCPLSSPISMPATARKRGSEEVYSPKFSRRFRFDHCLTSSLPRLLISPFSHPHTPSLPALSAFHLSSRSSIPFHSIPFHPLRTSLPQILSPQSSIPKSSNPHNINSRPLKHPMPKPQIRIHRLLLLFIKLQLQWMNGHLGIGAGPFPLGESTGIDDQDALDDLFWW